LARVWEVASGTELLKLKGHSAPLPGASFSPDGQQIVTCSYDQTAKVWDAASGRDLLTLAGHNFPVNAVAFSLDGRRIVTGGGADNAAKVWEAATPMQVAAWQAEERAADQSLAAMRRERTTEQDRQAKTRGRNSIKKWLILAPIALAAGQPGSEGIDLEQIEGEAQLRPKAGESSSIGGSVLKWRELALENYFIPFNKILGSRLPHHDVAYAVCYLRSETEQRGLQMFVESEDQSKVYLNERQVYRALGSHGIVAVQDAVPDITLNAGLNVLVFKLVNERYDWTGFVGLADSQGNPVKGIKVTLEPEAKDSP
jgi:hypothetical protein